MSTEQTGAWLACSGERVRTPDPGGCWQAGAGILSLKTWGPLRLCCCSCPLGRGCWVESSLLDYSFLSRLLQVAGAASEERKPGASRLEGTCK